MARNWLVVLVLPLLVNLNTVRLQPITEVANARRARQLDLNECCPCPGSGRSAVGLRASDFGSTSSARDCPCENRSSDPEASASVLLPALGAIQPFVKQTDEKTEPKPLLHPEVGLASSVLETLRDVTDEEYQDALARDEARSAIKLIESDSSDLEDTLTESPKNIVQIFLNQKDDMEDNLPQPSNIQETRCVHTPLASTHNMGQLRMSNPTPIIDVFDAQRRPTKTLKNSKSLLHRNLHEMDSSTGASNIEERIMQPKTEDISRVVDLIQTNKTYPTLFGLLSQNNKERTDDNIDPTIGPKMNVKLRDFLDNLETLKKEKTKLPVLDLKQYFATTTRLPPLKLKSLENPLFRNNKPLQLKDLIKLKDVELISQNNFAKNTTNAKNSILKLQNGIYDDEDTNFASSVNRDITTIREPTSFEPVTAVASETESNIVFDPDNNKAFQNSNNEEDLDSEASININNQPALTIPTDLQSQKFFDIDSTESEEESNAGDVLIQNDHIKNNKSSTECLSPNIELKKHEINNNALKTEFEHNSNSNLDTSTEELNNSEYEIEFVEDTSLPIEFDNSTFIPENNMDDTSSDKSTNEKLMKQEKLDDNVMETSSDNLKIIEQDGDIPNTSDLFFEDTVDDPIPNDNFSKIGKQSPEDDSEYSEIMARNVEQIPQLYDLNSENEIPEKNDIKERNSKYTHNHAVDFKDNSNQINMQDLQVMSDSILNLSECETLSNEKDSLEESNLKEDFNEIQTGDAEISNSALPSNIIISQDELPEDEIFAETRKATMHDDFNQDLCILPTSDDNIDNIKAVSNSNEKLDAKSNEMTAEASEPKTNTVTFTNPNLVEPYMSSLRNTIDDSINDDVVTKTTTGTKVNDILKINKHTKFFEDLKSKLDNLLSTTEKAPENKMFNNLEDSVNESSNTKPRLTLIDEFKTVSKPKNKPQNILQKTLPPQFPGLLNSYKSKLPVPKSLDRTINLKATLNSHSDTFPTLNVRKDKERQKDLRLSKPQVLKKTTQTPFDINNLSPTLRNNGQNVLTSPLDLSRPFQDMLDPHSALAEFSDRLRSHTEDSIQTLKETLESRLRESQSSGLSLNPDTFDTQDILESITNRRDELSEKFHAIHSDISDRFNNFQRSILDQLNLATSATNSKYAEESSNRGLRINPLQSIHSEALNPKTTAINGKQESQNHYSFHIPEENEITERLFKSSRTKSLPGLKNFDKTGLSQNTESKQPRLLEKNNLPSFNYKLPKITFNDRKLSLNKPVVSSTTKKPSSLPNPKYFKSRIPLKVYTETEEKITTDKPLLRKPGPKNIFSDELQSSSSHDSPIKNKYSEKNHEISREDDDSTNSPLDKLRKTLLRRNQDIKSRNGLKITSTKIKMPSSLVRTENDDQNDTVLSPVKEGRIRLGPQIADNALARNNGHKLRSQSNIDTEPAAAQEIEQIKLVEPLKENVPYKCKLICYKDVK